MASLKIRFDCTVPPAAIRLGLAGMLMLASAADLSSESVTLATYYPAPSGVYTNMIATGDAYLARDGGNVGIGTVAPNVKLDLRGVASSRVQFTLSDGNTASAMIRAGATTNAVYASDRGIVFKTSAMTVSDADAGGIAAMTLTTGGDVGIGKIPGAKLDVNGDIVARGCTARSIMPFLFVDGGSTVPCPANNYATWLPGIMSNRQTANGEPTGFGGNFYCCSCGGACPSLPGPP